MGKCGWEGHKHNMTEGNRAEDPENVRQKDGRSIIRQAVLALLLCGVAALVACAPVKEPERKEKTVLQLWHYWDREESRQCLAKLVQKFNDTHQDVEIQINYIADEDFKKRLVLAAADGEQPDLAIVDSSDIQYYDKAGILKDLSSEMKAENYLSRALISCRTKDGRLVGLPLGLNCLIFYYNKDILKQAGVGVPTTLEEFVTAAEAVTSDQVSGCAFPALQSEESSFCFLPILWNYGGSLAQIDSPAGRQAFGFLKQLAENRALSEDNVNMTISDIAWEFANGNIAMAFMTSGYENEIRKENPDLHFATTKLPCGENSITISGGEVLTVTCAEHEKAAREFVRFMEQPEQTELYLDSAGYLAARRDLLKKQVQTDPSKKAYWSYLKQAKLREIEPYWPSLSMEVAESINRVILGEDTQDELEQLSERISRIRRAKYEKE